MKLLGILFSLFVMLGLQLCVMLFGWGLKPISWGWVIWGSIGAIFVGALIQVCAEYD